MKKSVVIDMKTLTTLCSIEKEFVACTLSKLFSHSLQFLKTLRFHWWVFIVHSLCFLRTFSWRGVRCFDHVPHPHMILWSLLPTSSLSPLYSRQFHVSFHMIGTHMFLCLCKILDLQMRENMGCLSFWVWLNLPKIISSCIYFPVNDISVVFVNEYQMQFFICHESSVGWTLWFILRVLQLLLILPFKGK